MWWKNVDWIHLAQGTVKQRFRVNTVTDVGFHKSRAMFWPDQWLPAFQEGLCSMGCPLLITSQCFVLRRGFSDLGENCSCRSPLLLGSPGG